MISHRSILGIPAFPPDQVIETPILEKQQPSTRFGKQIDSIVSPPVSGGGGIQFPFQIRKINATDVIVRYGTVQDIVPINIATPITLAGSATYTFYLDTEVDIDGVVIGVTLSNASTGQPPNSDYHGYITIGSVVVDGDVITAVNQAATHSLRTAMCGRIVTDGVLTAAGTFEFWGF